MSKVCIVKCKIISTRHCDLRAYLVDVKTGVLMINYPICLQQLAQLACLQDSLVRKWAFIKSNRNACGTVHKGESIFEKHLVGFILACEQPGNQDDCGNACVPHTLYKIRLFLQGTAKISGGDHRHLPIDNT